MTEKRIKTDVRFRLHPTKKEALKEYCLKNDIKVQELLERYIDELIAKEVKK